MKNLFSKKILFFLILSGMFIFQQMSIALPIGQILKPLTQDVIKGFTEDATRNALREASEGFGRLANLAEKSGATEFVTSIKTMEKEVGNAAKAGIKDAKAFLETLHEIKPGELSHVENLIKSATDLEKILAKETLTDADKAAIKTGLEDVQKSTSKMAENIGAKESLPETMKASFKNFSKESLEQIKRFKTADINKALIKQAGPTTEAAGKTTKMIEDASQDGVKPVTKKGISETEIEGKTIKEKVGNWFKQHLVSIPSTLIAAVLFMIPNLIQGPIQDAIQKEENIRSLKDPQPFGIFTLIIPKELFFTNNDSIDLSTWKHSGFFIYESLYKDKGTKNYFVTAGTHYSDCGSNWGNDDLTSQYFSGVIHLNSGLEFTADGEAVNIDFPFRRFIGPKDADLQCNDPRSTIDGYLHNLFLQMETGKPTIHSYNLSALRTEDAKGGVKISADFLNTFRDSIMSPDSYVWQDLLHPKDKDGKTKDAQGNPVELPAFGAFKLSPLAVDDVKTKFKDISGTFPATALGAHVYKTKNTDLAKSLPGFEDYVVAYRAPSSKYSGEMPFVPAYVPKMKIDEVTGLSDGKIEWVKSSAPITALCSLIKTRESTAEGEREVINCYDPNSGAKISTISAEDFAPIEDNLVGNQARNEKVANLIKNKRDEYKKRITEGPFYKGNYTLNLYKGASIPVYQIDNPKNSLDGVDNKDAQDYFITVDDTFKIVPISDPKAAYMLSLVTSTVYGANKLNKTDFTDPVDNTVKPSDYYKETALNEKNKEAINNLSPLMNALVKELTQQGFNDEVANFIATALCVFLYQQGVAQILSIAKGNVSANKEISAEAEKIAKNLVQQLLEMFKKIKLSPTQLTLSNRDWIYNSDLTEELHNLTLPIEIPENLQKAIATKLEKTEGKISWKDIFNSFDLSTPATIKSENVAPLYIYKSMPLLDGKTLESALQNSNLDKAIKKSHDIWANFMNKNPFNWDTFSALGTFQFSDDVFLTTTSLEDIKNKNFVYISDVYPYNYFIVASKDVIEKGTPIDKTEKFVDQEYLVSLVNGFVYHREVTEDRSIVRLVIKDGNPVVADISNVIKSLKREELKKKINSIPGINVRYGTYSLALDKNDTKSPFIYQEVNFDDWIKLNEQERLKAVNSFFVATKISEQPELAKEFSACLEKKKNKEDYIATELSIKKFSPKSKFSALPEVSEYNKDYVLVNLVTGNVEDSQYCVNNFKVANPGKFLDSISIKNADLKQYIKKLQPPPRKPQPIKIKPITFTYDKNLVNSLLAPELPYLQKPFVNLKSLQDKYYRINLSEDSLIDFSAPGKPNIAISYTKIAETADALPIITTNELRKLNGVIVDKAGKESLTFPNLFTKFQKAEGDPQTLAETTLNDVTFTYKQFNFQEAGNAILIEIAKKGTKYYFDPISKLTFDSTLISAPESKDKQTSTNLETSKDEQVSKKIFDLSGHIADYPVYIDSDKNYFAILGNNVIDKRILRATGELAAFGVDNDKKYKIWGFQGPTQEGAFALLWDYQCLDKSNDNVCTSFGKGDRFLAIPFVSKTSDNTVLIDISKDKLDIRSGKGDLLDKDKEKESSKIISKTDYKMRIYEYVGSQDPKNGTKFDAQKRKLNVDYDSQLAILGKLQNDKWNSEKIFIYAKNPEYPFGSKYFEANPTSEKETITVDNQTVTGTKFLTLPEQISEVSEETGKEVKKETVSRYEVTLFDDLKDQKTGAKYIITKVKEYDPSSKNYKEAILNFYIPKYDRIDDSIINQIEDQVGYISKVALGGYGFFVPLNLSSFGPYTKTLPGEQALPENVKYNTEFKDKAEEAFKAQKDPRFAPYKAEQKENEQAIKNAFFNNYAQYGPYARFIYVYQEADKKEPFYMPGADYVNLDNGVLYKKTIPFGETVLNKPLLEKLIKDRNIVLPKAEIEAKVEEKAAETKK